MPTAPYFPSRTNDQIPWLINFRTKIANYQAALAYSAPEISVVQADCNYASYLLDTWLRAVRTFGESATSTVQQILYGTGKGTVDLPVFDLSAAPTPPPAVAQGALPRIFAFVRNLKTRDGYVEGIGQDLGVIGSGESRPLGAPEPKGEARSNEVVISFKKNGHMGVWVEGQVGSETTWHFLAIDTSNPYNDTRPLASPNQPEVRRYRLCYWDGNPDYEWSNVVTVTFGG